MHSLTRAKIDVLLSEVGNRFVIHIKEVLFMSKKSLVWMNYIKISLKAALHLSMAVISEKYSKDTFTELFCFLKVASGRALI